MKWIKNINISLILLKANYWAIFLIIALLILTSVFAFVLPPKITPESFALSFICLTGSIGIGFLLKDFRQIVIEEIKKIKKPRLYLIK